MTHLLHRGKKVLYNGLIPRESPCHSQCPQGEKNPGEQEAGQWEACRGLAPAMG